MTDPDRQQLQRELDQLKARLEALQRSQTSQMGYLKMAIEDLAGRLLEQAAPSAGVAPEVEIPVEEGVPVLEEVPVFAAEAPQAEPVHERVRPLPAVVVPAAVGEKSFEMLLGRVWLGRIGVAVLVTGLVLLGNFAYQNFVHKLPPILKLLFLYSGAGILAGTGIFVRKKESTALFGEVLLAGGLAFGYWCTFAAHHVPRLRVIESPVVGALLVFVAAGGITSLSLAWRSRIIGVMGLLLASYSTVLQPLGWLSSVSNLALALAGVVMMLRGGWAGPGIVAMAGSYLSFFWWQVIGGRPVEDPASLWFLPPVWAVFTASVLVRPSLELKLSQRAKSFFASANNVAFFLLFSGIWHRINGHEDYWLVAAAFGAVLLAVGITRPARQGFGGLFFAQGLAAITLAVVVKLEGYQLALGLAIQSAALAAAFSRFGGRSELTFSSATGIGAVCLCLLGLQDAPLWSNALVAGLVMAAGVFLRIGCDLPTVVKVRQDLSRGMACLLLSLGSGVLLFDFCDRLPAAWKPVSAAITSLFVAGGYLWVDRRKLLPEAGLISLAFGIYAAGLSAFVGHPTSMGSGIAVGLLSIATHWLWRHVAHDPAVETEALKWLRSGARIVTLVLVTAAIGGTILLSDLTTESKILTTGLAAVALAALGRFALRAHQLCISGALLLPFLFLLQWMSHSTGYYFVAVAASLGVLAMTLPVRKDRPVDEALLITHGISRFAAAASWWLACRQVWPEEWGDVTGLTALVLGAFAMRKEAHSLYSEMTGFLGISISWFVARAVDGPWTEISPVPSPVGWVVVLAALALGFMKRARTQPERVARDLLLWVGMTLLAVWSTLLEVWSFGWKPVVVMWAALGFSAVSVGLWRKLAMLRHTGFAVLGVAMGKLFISDVWDLGAFVRIVAFLALGAALVLLGFFYNRFADVIKKLFEPDRSD
ncbi:MAG: hypothetical protein JWO82_3706 [Akkermansiaceae bacterium]|nr:hypothetical protein [Akkermansiaceae bacterium]